MTLPDHINRAFRLPDYTIEHESDHALAQAHAPRINFDAREPFLPVVVGYTVFDRSGQSASFPREVVLGEGETRAIEYAIWWDWDIEHLYELEHAWVYLDAHGNPVRGEASWHGGYHAMIDEHGWMPLADGRLSLYSEPGKHAFAPSPQWLLERAPRTGRACGTQAGKMGVHITPLFKDMITGRTPRNNRLVHTYLERQAFEPDYEFSNVFELAGVTLAPWEVVFKWIPGRVQWWLGELDKQIPMAERRVLRIAHRGASAAAQENSAASIRQAEKLGADMVEVDIRLTADDVPVVCHDDSLRRVFGVNDSVSNLTLEALRAATATPDHLEPIMTLDEVVAVCHSFRLGLYLDVKQLNQNAADSMLASLNRRRYLPHTIFGSHRPDWLAEIKACTPDAVTSILFSSVHVDPVLLARAVNADYVHPCWERFDAPHTLLTEEWIGSVREAGLGIVCWHEERPAVIAALKARGVDAICSDQPELLVVH